MRFCAAQHKECIKNMDSAPLQAANRAMREPVPMPRTPPALPSGWRAPSIASLAVSLAMVAAAAGVLLVLHGSIPSGSVALVFLVAVLLSAVFYGFWTGIAAASLAFLAYNYLFVEPVMTFRVADPEDFLALAVFVLVAGLTGSLAGRLREQATASEERARLLEHLSELSIALGHCGSEAEARQATILALSRLTGGTAMLIDRTLDVDPPLGLEDAQAAERALRHGVAERAAAAGWSGGRYDFCPVVAGGDGALVAGVEAGPAGPERRSAVRSAIEQAGVVIQRLRLAEEAAESRRKAERESIRAALLSSLSHDLKTPLAAILGSVTTLRQFADSLPEPARKDLLLAIEDEARRLNLYVGNLLQMTRLQSGLDARLEWSDPRDILNAAVNRAQRDHPGRRLIVRVVADPPLMRTDAVLLEQAVFNCLDNAAAIAPQGAPIVASLELEDGRLGFSIEDEGPGVPPDEQVLIFEPFQRGSAAAAGGTGLGLAIAKGIVQTLGGDIGVDSPIKNDRGARFWLNFHTGGGPAL